MFALPKLGSLQGSISASLKIGGILAIRKRFLIRNDLEIHETTNRSDRSQRFGASCTIIKVTQSINDKKWFMKRESDCAFSAGLRS